MNINKSFLERQVKGNQKLSIKSSFGIRSILSGGLLLVLIIISMLLWAGFQKRNLRAKHVVLERDLKKEVRSELDEITRDFLATMSKTYAWAIKHQMLKGNIKAMDTYGEAISKYENFISVMVVNRRGTIITSTDNVYEGKKFISFNSPYYLNVDSTVVYRGTPNVFTMATPIMDNNEKLGTIVINYSVDQQQLF